LALRLALHLLARPGELRHAEWQEVDFEHAEWQGVDFEKTVWIIPGSKTKMGKDHQVPLSRHVSGSDQMTAHGFQATASTS
jgi:integrase